MAILKKLANMTLLASILTMSTCQTPSTPLPKPKPGEADYTFIVDRSNQGYLVKFKDSQYFLPEYSYQKVLNNISRKYKPTLEKALHQDITIAQGRQITNTLETFLEIIDGHRDGNINWLDYIAFTTASNSGEIQAELERLGGEMKQIVEQN